MTTHVSTEKVRPKIGINFRVYGIYKNVYQEKCRNEHTGCGILLEEVICQGTKLLEHGQANDQWKKSLH